MRKDDITSRIDASPTKEFFISMLVKDIELIRAIIDLVDNSIDGASRIREDGDYSGLAIRIEANKDLFSISDNCGGIPMDIAKNYAFRFGRPDDAPSIPHTIGLFGVGMKRTIFKLGKKFKIESKTETSDFLIEEDVDEWQMKDGWHFNFVRSQENIDPPLTSEECGTTITVTDLFEHIANDFDLENFRTRLAHEISDAHLNSLNNNLAISLNGIPLIDQPICLQDSQDIKPAYKELKLNPNGNGQILVKMYAGISEASPSAAGWYIFCNGRLVLKADRSGLTGWGANNGSTIPQYHNDYARFRGYAFFEADDARLLPWNTTKTGVDADSGSFRAARLEMIPLMRPVIDFLRKLRQEKSDLSESQENPLELALEKTSQTKIFEVSTDYPAFQAPKPETRPKPKVQTIQYRKPLEEVQQVKEVLEATTYKEVGEKTFEYFYKRECED